MYVKFRLYVHRCLFIYLFILIMDLSTTFASIRKQVAGLSLVALVAGLFAAGVATAATENIFSDVPADAWYAGYVNDLATAGVIDSTKDMYRPGDLVNRAEMGKFAFMVSGLPLETASAAPYKDVAMGQWYTDYIYTLTKNGIVSGDKANGVPTGYFRPEAPLNRAEAAKMLVNAAAMAEDITGNPHFPDVTSGAWYFNFVETAFNNGVVSGYPDGNYRPSNNINRAEAAKMVFLSMNPVAAGFTLDSAAAASKTTVELIFSMNVDSTLAADEANYTIEDSTGNKLAVSAAEVTAADTVMLTTGTQTAGKVYYVTVKNLESDAGDVLANTDSVSFLGYGADVTGGALEVALSTQTPVAGSIPSGATGVVFTCWDFMAGSSAATVKSLTVHRVGPGSDTAFANVYLYNGDARLTTGRSLSSESQTVEFSNINQEVAAGENMKICLVADLAVGVSGGVHAFEIASADAVSSNSSNMTGSFPLRGADQLVTSAAVGSTKISKNGSLDEVTIGTEAARIAQFEIEAGSSEDQQLERIALYVRGRVSASNVTNLKLYVIGDTTVLATAASVGAKDLATLVLDKPFKIGRGQSKIFYVTADIVGARSGDDVKVYVDETTDVLVTGITYGYGTQMNIIGAFAGDGYDGAEGPDAIVGNADDNYSYVKLKGSKFMIGFTGPVASDVPVNQKQVQCLDMTITNAAGLDVTIKDWIVKLDVTAVGPTADGLVDNTTATPVANYTLVKLVKLNDDGTVSGTLLGSSELSVAPGFNDLSQNVTLKGTSSLASGDSVKAAVVFDVANNAALSGNTIKCSLLPVTGADMVKDSNNDPLTAADITPSSTIAGNTHTLVTSALDFTKNSSPSNGTKYAKGTNLATLYSFQAKAGSSLDTTIKSLAVKGDNTNTRATMTGTTNATGVVVFGAITGVGSGYLPSTVYTVTPTYTGCTTAPTGALTVTSTPAGDFTGVVGFTTNTMGLGVGCTVGPVTLSIPDNNSTTDIKDLVDSIGIYDSTGTLVSDLKSFPASAAGLNSSVITFNNLDIKVLKNANINLFLKGTVSNSLTGTASASFAFDAAPALPLVIDQNGQTVTGVSVTNVEWTAGQKLSVVLGTTPTVNTLVTAANDPKIFSENSTAPVLAFTLKSSNGNSKLQDMLVKLTSAAAVLPVESAALYTTTTSGLCEGATLLKDYESVTSEPPTDGYVKFTNINKTLTDSQNVYFCLYLKSKTVSGTDPVSNSDITFNNAPMAIDPSANAIVFTKVQDESGALITAPSIDTSLSAPSAGGTFFKGIPTFASQTLSSTIMTAGTNDILVFKAGSIGPVDSITQLAVSMESSVAPTSCDLYRGATLLNTAGAATIDNLAPLYVATWDTADFPTGSFSWNNGSDYTVKCSFAAVATGDSVKAKIFPIDTGAMGASYDSAVIWDDGNGALLADPDAPLGFGLVDNIIFYSNVVAQKLSAL